MKHLGNIFTALFALGALALGLWEITNPPEESEEEEGEEATFNIKSEPLEAASWPLITIGYGQVLSGAGTTLDLTLPVDVRVKRLFVSAGQVVNKGDALAEIAPTSEVTLLYTQAQSELSAAQRELDSVTKRVELHLATNSEQNAAEAAVTAAKQQRDNLLARGAAGARTLKADAAGVVGQGIVNEHAFVPAGSPVLSLLDTAHIEAKLGVPPEDASKLSIGQSVILSSIEGNHATATGTLRSIGRAINPDTRMLDVYVTLADNSAGILLGAMVRGEFQGAPSEGLVAPRSAILLSDEGTKIFIVEKDSAKEVGVTVLLEHDDDVLLTGEGLHEGMSVVVEGNYELSDGAHVEEAEDEDKAEEKDKEKDGDKEETKDDQKDEAKDEKPEDKKPEEKP